MIRHKGLAELTLGHRLDSGQTMYRKNGTSFVMMTEDGHLTINKIIKATKCADKELIFEEYKEIWKAPLKRKTQAGAYATVRNDGHFCLLSENGEYIWCAPFSKGTFSVKIEEDCMNAYDMEGRLTWTSCDD